MAGQGSLVVPFGPGTLCTPSLMHGRAHLVRYMAFFADEQDGISACGKVDHAMKVSSSRTERPPEAAGPSTARPGGLGFPPPMDRTQCAGMLTCSLDKPNQGMP